MWTCLSVSIYNQILLSYPLPIADEPHSTLLLLLLLPPAVSSWQLSPSSFWGPAFLSERAAHTGVTVPGACAASCLCLGEIPNRPCSFANSLSLPATHRLLGWSRRTQKQQQCKHHMPMCLCQGCWQRWCKTGTASLEDIPLWGTHPHTCMPYFQHNCCLMRALLLVPSPVGVLAAMQDLALRCCDTNGATQR